MLDGGWKKAVKKMPRFFSQLKRSRQYKKIYKQTQEYLELSKNQWEKNYSLTIEMIYQLTALNLNKKFRVYITHPSIGQGRHLGNNKILWGHKDDWPNYITVYLWHEILHSYFKDSHINHAIIELIADNELRSRLNKVKYPPFAGHKPLHPLRKKILPYWRKYLKQDKKDIKKFTKEMNKKFGKVKVRWYE